MPKRKRTKSKKDKWRAKQWYRIYASDTFHKAQIGETLSANPTELMNRITEVTLNELTGELSKTHIKLKFKITELEGNEANTKFVGHQLTSDYIRRLTRRRRSKMDGVFDVITNDGYNVRIKPMAIAEKRIQSSQQRAIREKMGTIVESYSKSKTLSELLMDMVNGSLSAGLFRECKLIYPVKRIEIRKSEILGRLGDKIEEKSEDNIIGEKIIEEKEIPEGKEATIKEFIALPGVGPSKAEILYEEGFTNLEQLREANLEEISNVKKIGKSLADKIYEALHPPQEESEE